MRGRGLALATARMAAGPALEIHPPAGFTAKQSSPDADEVTTYEVTTTSDPDTGCTIDVVPSKGSVRRAQSQLNAAAATPAFREGVEAALAEQFDVTDIRPFGMQGAIGVIATGDVKASEGTMRASIVVVDTPRGRAQVACIADRGDFEAWRPRFEAIARGVVLPR